MKLFAAAAIVLLSLASSFSFAEQTTTPVRQNQRDTMIIPSDHNDSPFDFNHMAAGNDKSDELGVPYYCLARRNLICARLIIAQLITRAETTSAISRPNADSGAR